MRLCSEPSRHKRSDIFSSLAFRTAPASQRAFTLMEVMVVMALMTILIVSGFSAILSMKVWSNRLADYTAAMAVVEAKVQDIRAATYNPPNYPFGSSTLNLTNNGSIMLNKAGATFLISGTIVSQIKPVATGHLITVTGTFPAPHKPVSVTLQTIVNRYSGGQQ